MKKNKAGEEKARGEGRIPPMLYSFDSFTQPAKLSHDGPEGPGLIGGEPSNASLGPLAQAGSPNGCVAWASLTGQMTDDC
jgi:hypothetical protein